jgi:iron(III) transport system permease protein
VPFNGWAILTIVTACCVVAPIAMLIWYAAAGSLADWPHLIRFVLPQALLDTLLLLAGVAVVSGSIGTLSAWLISAYRFPGRDLIAVGLILPLAVPTYIVAYTYVEAFDFFGPLQTALRALFGFTLRSEYWFPDPRGLVGAIFVIGLVLAPYVYVPVRAVLSGQSASIIEAGRMLGSTGAGLMWRVALPSVRPAIAVGLTLALLETLNDVGASEYLGVRTLTVTIYTTWLNRGSLAGAAQIAVLMLILIAVLMAVERHLRDDRRFSTAPKQVRKAEPVLLQGTKAWVATVVCLLPVLFGFALPAGILMSHISFADDSVAMFADLAPALVNSLTVSALATTVVVALGLTIALGQRLAPSPSSALAGKVSGSGYALPGTVLVLGLLPTLAGLDSLLNAVAASTGLPAPGLVLSGSLAAIMLAYTIRFLIILIGQVHSGLSRISPSIDHAARVLGSRRSTVGFGILTPMLKPVIAGAALLVFVDCMKELPATLLLRPFNFETLATLLYGHAARGSFEDGALAALLIVLVGLTPVAVISWHMDRLRHGSSDRS